MSWEFAIVFCYLAMAGLFLFIGINCDNKQFPLKMIFVTLAFGCILFALNTCVVLTDYATPIINNANISESLNKTVVSSYTIMHKVFWIFLLITFFVTLFEVVNILKKKK